jgi:hypothetical protein
MANKDDTSHLESMGLDHIHTTNLDCKSQNYLHSHSSSRPTSFLSLKDLRILHHGLLISATQRDSLSSQSRSLWLERGTFSGMYGDEVGAARSSIEESDDFV